MKSLKYIKILMVIVLLSFICNKMEAQKGICNADSIEISILTCSPHSEIYSLYGHTAIRFQDKAQGMDFVVNYGVFSFHKPYFVLRFVLGLTDYEMGIVPFEDFCQEYSYYGSKVIQQTLNLSDEEKIKITKALQNNYEPENRVYRYNYFYNNCTTKARDIILENIDGNIVYNNKINTKTSFRDMIHSCNEDYRWARFGNDLLLGVKADLKTTREDQQFLPKNLMTDFASAYVVKSNGTRYPLIKDTQTIVMQQDGVNESSLTPTPTVSFLMIAAVIAIISLLELVTHKRFIFIDIILMILQGTAGIILFAMLFSQHPTTSTNLQILLLNPLWLFVAIYIIRNKHNINRQKNILKICLLTIFTFILCGIFQDYAEGINILAWSLLMRTMFDLYFLKINEK